MIRAEYKGLVADIRNEDLRDALIFLHNESDKGRAAIMQGVLHALNEVIFYANSNKKIAPKTLHNAANDICIWYANEIIEGRIENPCETLGGHS